MNDPRIHQDSRAILIGTSRYDHGLDSIPAVAANLADLADILTGVGGAFTTEHCVTVTDPDRTTDVGDAVGRAAREATGVLLVYYAGHGLIDRQGRLHLAVTGSDPDRIRWTAVPFETLREEILDSPARIRILILDCCFAGRAFEAMADVPGLVAGQTELRGTYTIASSAANEPSFAPRGHRHTAFTGALLAAAAAAPGSSLDEVYVEVERSLQRSGCSRPRRRSVDSAGEIRLFGRPGHEHRYRRAADAGDAEAMNNLVDLLYNRGDLAEAEIWVRRAADAGHPKAMTSLGNLLHNRGDITGAKTWYRHAAETGDSYAMTRLAVALYISDDLPEAEIWARHATNAGDLEAMNLLGVVLYIRGDLAEAEAWLQHAADAGNPDAMNNLGELLTRRNDVTEAKTWFRRAADAGHPNAMKNLDELLFNRAGQRKRWPWSNSG